MNTASDTDVALATRQNADRLTDALRPLRRVAVAFSGGVDSSVVAQAAYLACGEQATAVTALGAALPHGEDAIAADTARKIGIRHVTVGTDELAVAGYVRNTGDRCYFCKTVLYDEIVRQRDRLGFDVILNGANADDAGDHRPGMRAAAEQGVRSPLMELGLTKSDVRDLARFWNLPTAEKPANPCLASRLAYGVEVTADRLARIDAAERFLRDVFQIDELRVRCEAGELARLELPLSVLQQAVSPAIRETVATRLKDLGFRCVTVDLEGFRSGNLNTLIPANELQRWTERR